MSDRVQNSQSESHSKLLSGPLTRIHSSDSPPITTEDLVKLGIEPQRIPLIISTTLRTEQLPSDSPPLSLAGAQNLVEVLDKVRIYPQIPAGRTKTPGDQVVSSTTTNPSLKNRCFRILRKVSPSHGILPKSYHPEGGTLSDTTPYASGGFADIWKGQRDGSQVCVKAFQNQTVANLGKIKRVCGGILTRG